MSSKRQVVIFLIFVIGCILLLSLIFGGSKGGSSKAKNQKKLFSLLDYANGDSEVVSITDGRINGDDLHRAVRITVNQYSRKIDIVQGYQGNVIASKSYDNNQKAYKEFINALAKTGFGKPRKTAVASEHGVCAGGRRYVFELLDKGYSVSRTWTANCIKGSSPADPDLVTSLFRRQITDYSEVTKNLDY